MRGIIAKNVIRTFVLVGAVLLLNACHTIAGMGEDISHAGKGIEHQANKHAP